MSATDLGTEVPGDDTHAFRNSDWSHPADQPPLRLDWMIEGVGGFSPENFPKALDYQGSLIASKPVDRILGLPGRLLLRLINVVPDRCPPQERTKFYLLALTVLLNASTAAYTTPTGLSVAFPHLSVAAKIGLATLGAGVVGVMDALIVGYWLSAAKYRVKAPAEPPPLPGLLKRAGVFVPRLAFTLILVFGLGLLLTLSVNKGVINKQLALNVIQDRNTAIQNTEKIDVRLIATDTSKLKTALRTLHKDQLQQTKDADRASCELYGTPRVYGCSPDSGVGPVYRFFSSRAKGSDQQAIDLAQESVNSISVQLINARRAESNAGKSPEVTRAATTATGLSAVRAAWNQYATGHDYNWIDRHLMDLLILAVDIVPLGMKLASGVSSYEAIGWENEWHAARVNEYRRRAEHKRLATLENLYSAAADSWRTSRENILTFWFDGDSANPGSYPYPSPPVTSASLPSSVSEPQSSASRPRRTPSQNESGWHSGPGVAIFTPGLKPTAPGPVGAPMAEQSFKTGDIVQLSAGRYKLLFEITKSASYNGDVFIAAMVRQPGQAAPTGRDLLIRAVKFTRSENDLREAELAFANHFPAPGETLLRAWTRKSADGRQLIYESPYFPRSDVMRYLYGRPRDHFPRISVRRLIDIMRDINDGHRRIWEDGFLHNDTRLRNLIMTGPLVDDNTDPIVLTPRTGREGRVMLCDWGSLTFCSEAYDADIGVTVSMLEGDPAVWRFLLRDQSLSTENRPPIGFASDQYSLFSCAYQLATGGISPTEGLLIYRHHNDPKIVAGLDGATYGGLFSTDVQGWPEVLEEDPFPVRYFNPDLPESLAQLIDDGLRSDPLLREPRIAGLEPRPAAREVATALEERLATIESRLTIADIERLLPGPHEHYIWWIDPPIGWPIEVISYVAEHWPEYGVGI